MSIVIRDQIHQIVDQLTPDQLLTLRLFIEDLRRGEGRPRARLSVADSAQRRMPPQRDPGAARKLRDMLYRRALGLDDES